MSLNLQKVELKEAMKRVQDGWLAQFRGANWISKIIKYSTGGPHSHSAMLQRNNGTVDTLEVREFYGGRRLPLEAQHKRSPGKIDVFSIDSRFSIDTKETLRVMRSMTGKDYGYRGIVRLATQKIPLLWRLWPLHTRDDEPIKNAPFCSHAVCYAYRMGGVDPVPNKPDYYVTPNDLTHSLLFKYEFTI